jgi:hypothetical protein
MTDTANTLLYDKAVDRAAMIRLYEKRINGKVELVLNGHTVRVDKLIKEAKASSKGMLKLREAIDQDLRKTYKEVFSVTRRSFLDLARDQLSFTVQTMNVAMGKVLKVNRPTRRVAEEIVLERPLANDMTLAEGWANVSLNEKKRLEQIIRKGIAKGQSADEIALAVRKGNVHKIITRYISQMQKLFKGGSTLLFSTLVQLLCVVTATGLYILWAILFICLRLISIVVAPLRLCLSLGNRWANWIRWLAFVSETFPSLLKNKKLSTMDKHPLESLTTTGLGDSLSQSNSSILETTRE